MSPLQRYDWDVSKKLVSLDNEQRSIVRIFESLYFEILRNQDNQISMPGFLKRLFRKKITTEPEVKGVYLWGGVGRGKTYLMDLFFECIPFSQKERTHFHRFMLSVHEELKKLQGKKNPLDLIAKSIADRVKILFFDEFFVSDIGDAMLLSGLLEALFRRGVVLVATSNINPDDLYKNGLQRERFLPAIHLITKHTITIELKSGVDYRLQKLSKARLYYFPNDEKADAELLRSFNALVPHQREIRENYIVKVLDRNINARFHAGDLAWFDFLALCDAPRSAFDYVEISKIFHAIIISGIPQFGDGNDDKARRFVNLIDELYDRRVKLIVSSDVSISNLYQGRSLTFEFKRTESRLLEMQSTSYLGSPHLIIN
jgi:cell division protein ZapE